MDSGRNITSTTEKVIAEIIKYTEACANCVWLNPQDFDRLNATFVTISGRVYKTVRAKWMTNPGTAGLSHKQQTDLESLGAVSHNKCVVISPFHPSETNHRIMNSLTFALGLPERKGELEESIIIDSAELSAFLHKSLDGHFFQFGQSLQVCFKNRILSLTLERGEGIKTPKSHNFFNKIAERTRLYFKTPEDSQIFLIARQPINDRLTFTFNVSIKKEERKEKGKNYDAKMNREEALFREIMKRHYQMQSYKEVPHPLLFSEENLKKMILDKLQNQYINAKTTKIFYQDGCQIRVVLKEVSQGKEKFSGILRIGDNAARCHKAFYLSPKSNIELQSSQFLEVVKGNPIPATFVDIKLDEVLTSMGSRRRKWISASAIKKEIIEKMDRFVLGTRFHIFVDKFEYTVEIDRVDPLPSIQKGKSHWKLGEQTEIKLSPHPVLKKMLVFDDTARSLKKLTLKIESEIKNMNQDELREAILYYIPEKICPGESFTISLEEGKRVSVVVDSMAFDESQLKQNSLGFVDKEKTKLKIIGKEGPIKKRDSVKIHDPVKALEKIDLVGPTEEQIKLAKSLLLYNRANLKDLMKQFGIKPTKGVMLYGPPGTGKTSFAKKFANEVLDVPNNRITFISADDLKDSLLGGTERAIRNLFKKPREAGKSGPLHAVVIDEADSIGGTKGITQNFDHNFINALKTQLSEIQKMNVIVFLITNYPERFDKALIRDGRIDAKVQFGLPSRRGRKAIFEHYMRSLVKNNRLADDIDLDHLAVITSGIAGSGIENIVRTASLNSVLDDKEKVTMEDFKNAFDEVVNPINHGRAIPNDSGKIRKLSPADALKELGLALPKEIIHQIEPIVCAYRKGPQFGLKRPRGLILNGQPGTGKSTLAKAVIQMLGVPNHHLKILDGGSIVNEFKANRRKNFRDFFIAAKQAGESSEDSDQLYVLMIENIELLDQAMHSQLFVELDQLKHLDNLFLIATLNTRGVPTAHPTLQKLGGRLPAEIKLDLPEYPQRMELLKLFTKSIQEGGRLDDDVSLKTLTSHTDGFTISQIKSLVSTAWSYSLVRDQKGMEKINMDDFDNAFKNISKELKSKTMYG